MQAPYAKPTDTLDTSTCADLRCAIKPHRQREKIGITAMTASASENLQPRDIDVTAVLPAHVRGLMKGIIHCADVAITQGAPFSPCIIVGNTRTGTARRIDIDAHNANGKQIAAHQARIDAEVINADFAITTSKVHTLPAQLQLDTATAIRRYGSLSATPGSVEQVLFVVETQEGIYSSTAQIYPTGEGGKRMDCQASSPGRQWSPAHR